MPKGHTNNPNGRPKGAKNKATVDIKNLIQSNENWPAMISKLFIMAFQQENVAAFKLLMEYGFGKPSQPITGEDGDPIQHEHAISIDEDTLKSIRTVAKLLADSQAGIREG